MNYKTFFSIILVAILSVLPLLLIKVYTIHKNKWLIIISIIIYLITIFIYMNILGKFELIVIYPILKIISYIFVIGFGVIFLKESLNTRKYIGILLGFLAILATLVLTFILSKMFLPTIAQQC